MSTAKDSAAAAGLRGVVAAQSKIGDVDGVNGVLIYQGYDIHDLANNSTFEEVVFLLWNARLPKSAELEELKSKFRENYDLQPEVVAMMKSFPKDSIPMDVSGQRFQRLIFTITTGTDRSRTCAKLCDKTDSSTSNHRCSMGSNSKRQRSFGSGQIAQHR